MSPYPADSFTITILDAFPRVVARAEARPTENTWRLNRKVKSLGWRDTLVLPFSPAYIMIKNTTDARLEHAVAMAAPATFRLNPKIKMGSSTTLRIPPNIIPMLAGRAWPSLLRRCPKDRLSMVGIPPATTTQLR